MSAVGPDPELEALLREEDEIQRRRMSDPEMTHTSVLTRHTISSLVEPDREDMESLSDAVDDEITMGLEAIRNRIEEKYMGGVRVVIES